MNGLPPACCMVPVEYWPKGVFTYPPRLLLPLASATPGSKRATVSRARTGKLRFIVIPFPPKGVGKGFIKRGDSRLPGPRILALIDGRIHYSIHYPRIWRDLFTQIHS